MVSNILGIDLLLDNVFSLSGMFIISLSLLLIGLFNKVFEYSDMLKLVNDFK